MTGVDVMPTSGVMFVQLTSVVFRGRAPPVRKLVCHSGEVAVPSASKA